MENLREQTLDNKARAAAEIAALEKPNHSNGFIAQSECDICQAYTAKIAAIITKHLRGAAVPEPHCWHCGVVLAYAPTLRCEDCPTECDIENCDELGCAPPTED